MPMNSCEVLTAKRSAFNAYSDTVVRPMLGLSVEQMNDLDFADVAKRIDDHNVRSRHCELAVDMLDANIAHYRPDATAMSVHERSNSAVIVSTLLVSAIAHHLSGLTAALIAAAAWYWCANETANRRARQHAQEAMAHNELVSEWVETLQEWEATRNELSSM